MKYFYKKSKRVKKISNTDSGKDLLEKGYIQVSNKYDPENSIIKIEKPKPKAKPKPKVKPKAKKDTNE